MDLKLTEKQFRELLLSVIIGTYIREAVAELKGESLEHTSDLEKYLLSVAKDFNAEDMIENFKGALIPSSSVCEKYHDEIIEEYNNEEFWERLIRDLGQRDFAKKMTEKDKEYIKKNDGWLPEKIHKFYDYYRKEFEKHGIERIKIVKDKN